MKTRDFIPVFVEEIPADLREGHLYISTEYATALHKCACGCGIEVVTPLAPTDWKLIYDGSVSLHPSIGNWSFPCRSHYWIRSNRVQWAAAWSDEQVRLNREFDIERKKAHSNRTDVDEGKPAQRKKTSFWNRIVAWFR